LQCQFKYKIDLKNTYIKNKYDSRLSLIDIQLQSLLRSKQALMYTSMILTTYKLDSNYLDRFIMEITNSASKSSDKQLKENCEI